MTLLTFALAHPVVAGLGAAALFALAGQLVGKIPEGLLSLLVRGFTVRLEVTGNDKGYEHLLRWLSQHAGAGSTRTLKLAVGAAGDLVAEPGYGSHLLWEGGPLIVTRTFDADVESSRYWGSVPERLAITAFGRSAARARLVAMIGRMQGSREDVGPGVRVWHVGSWLPLPHQIKRTLDSVLIDPEMKEEILGHTRWFFENERWFHARGVPYRCGYLFTGPGGTGKTSMVTALAAHFKRPIYILNLSTVLNDNDLLNAFMMAAANAIILIEDVDAANTAARVAAAPPEPEKAPADPRVPSPPGSEPERKGVTLTGLLNALDGVAASEGRLLIMTSNHPERLDPALVRSSRIDKRWELGPLTPDLVEEMAERFFPDEPAFAATARSQAELDGPMVASDWQGRFMDRARDTMAR